MQNDTPTLASDARLFFAEQVKKARQKLGETQTEFANRFGVATNTISRYETGLYQPSDEVILACLMINDELKDDTPATLQHANEAIKHLTQVIDELTNKLATELERQRREYVEAVEKLKYGSPKSCDESYWSTRGDDVLKSQVYFEALADVLAILKKARE